MDIINEYFKKHKEWPRPAIQCTDGFRISVQAHYGAYCSPRPMSPGQMEYIDEYFQVECGYPSAEVPELAQWKDGDKEDRSSDTESVYGYVPVSVVLALIEKHGGLKQ
jgi:hypothetical protein